jgi:hypothetical protein
MEQDFENIIRARVEQRVPIQQLKNAGIEEFYIGGNSLNKDTPNDIDIFPSDGKYFNNSQAAKLGTIVCCTTNAITVRVGISKLYNHHQIERVGEIVGEDKTVVVQLCNYIHNSLPELVESFDFSHIQIGAKVKNSLVNETYYSKAYLNSKLCQSTEYTGSEYPTSSLIRSYKYAKRGDFAGNSHIVSVFKIMNDIFQRSFDDYEDFKDQLDAVDLGLVVGSEEDSKTSDYLVDFYNTLHLSRVAILKDPYICVEFAKHTKNRFVQGEDTIAQLAQTSLRYAADVLKDRFEKGEEIISKETHDIYDYFHILKAKNIKLPESMHNIMIAHATNNDRWANLYFDILKKEEIVDNV